MELNQETYNREDVIAQYDQFQFLFKAEKRVFDTLDSYLKNATVLDIGVGAGRTTQHLAKRCKKYVGVDYSQNFIDHCKTKLSSLSNASFEFADARAMPQFANNSFDFILFSFNGIDSIDIGGRNLVLKECKRILKNDGFFCFSFHNFYTIPKLYSLYISKNPLKWRASWRRYKLVNKLNPSINAFLNENYIILRDGENNFETDVMYMKPEFQLKLLRDLGFEPLSFHDVERGTTLSEKDFSHNNAQWIKIVAKINK